MLNKYLFLLTHLLYDKRFITLYNGFKRNEKKLFEELLFEQENYLKIMLNFCYYNVPFYSRLFKNLQLVPSDIKTIKDLELLPILTKETIKNNWTDFIPLNMISMKYYNRATGGSTGVPFQYRISKEHRLRAGVLLYRGWSYGDFSFGDKIIFIAGTSLDVNIKNNIFQRMNGFLRNLKKYSAFDMNHTEMIKFSKSINSFKPKFIRGYASSIFYFAKWLIKNNIKIYKPHSVFTTSEKLYDYMRKTIQEAFNCDVYDGYGLTDGGVTAFECREHNGLHIDTENAIMEICNDKGKQLQEEIGQIVATSLFNFAMPFIRYNTNDLGQITKDKCKCGRSYPLLKEVVGRDKELLITPDDKRIHGAAFFNNVFMEVMDVNSIDEFQIIQNDKYNIIINLVCNKQKPNNELLKRISYLVSSRSNGWKVEFNFVNKLDKTKAGKYRFIINNINSDSQ